MQRAAKRTIRGFFTAGFLLLAAPLFAQNQNWDVYDGLQYARFHPMAFDEPVEPFVNGPAWNLAVTGGVGDWFRIKADISRTALYDTEGDLQDHTPVSLLTYTFGPVFYLRSPARRNGGFERPGSKMLFGEVLLDAGTTDDAILNSSILLAPNLLRHLGLLESKSEQRRLRGWNLHHCCVLVHSINIVRKSSSNDFACSVQHLRRDSSD